MLTNYYNAAILTVKETLNGVQKLERIKGETTEQYNKRRKEYHERLKRKKNIRR
jgi:hypothetical protein